MVLIGCKPEGRHTEQHDVFFGIGVSISDLLPEIIRFWPEAKGKMHIDGWRAITYVDSHSVTVIPKNKIIEQASVSNLFFINLGGYKPNELEEFHYKMVVAAPGKNEAMKQSKQSAFFKHTGFTGATAHIDDKYGVDVDDIYDIRDILSESYRSQYRILLVPVAEPLPPDEMHLGYFRLSSFE